MDEPRHDLLAGARRAGDQHGRLHRGDLRRLAQHPPPFGGLADDVQLRGGLQPVDPALDAEVDPLRTGVIDVCDAGGFAAADREAEVVGDPSRERQVRRD